MSAATKEAFLILLPMLVELVHRVEDDDAREDLADSLEELRLLVTSN